MVGSKEAGVTFVMSLRISSSRYPTASLAAILAIGNGGFRSERGAAGNARVHLDNDHAAILRIDGELHVRSAGIDADFAQAADGAIAHHLIFAIGEGLGGSDCDRVAGMDAHGVEIFDGADDDYVVGEIAHDFELELFPAEGALFDENFVDGREVESTFENGDEIFVVVRDASAGTAHGETGAQDGRVAVFRGEGEST